MRCCDVACSGGRRGEMCAERGMGLAVGIPVGRGESRMMHSFRALHASYDKGVSEWGMGGLDWDVVGVAINQG
jgi:hypothetical protein